MKIILSLSTRRLLFHSTLTAGSTRTSDSNLLVNELNDTLSYLDSVEQLLLLTSTSFSKIPTASFNHRVRELN